MEDNLENLEARLQLDAQQVSLVQMAPQYAPTEKQYSARGSICQGYLVMCTRQAASSLRDPTYMSLFKQKFREILAAPAIAKANTNKNWGYVWKSRVIEGRLNKNLRIIFEIEENTVHVYEVEKHEVYERKILPLLKKGLYIKKETRPLDKFSSQEATVLVA